MEVGAEPAMQPRTLDGPDDDDDMIQQFGEAQKKIPHYALPNVAAILPDYANMEQETIMQAFRTGNCEYWPRYTASLAQHLAPSA